MKLSRTVQRVIDLGQAASDYWDAELPKYHPDYPIERLGDAECPPPPDVARLRELLGGLPDEEFYRLALIATLGQGLVGTDDLAAALETVKDRFDERELAVGMLAGHPSIAYQMEVGLEKLQRRGFNIDTQLDNATAPVAQR